MADKYNVVLRPSAGRDLGRLDGRTFERICAELQVLKNDARPQGVKKLVGRDNEYRLRVGKYRILYEFVDNEKTIRVFRVSHRREAYR